MPVLTPRAYDKLIKHNWPGNIRELKNVVERAAILCETTSIDIDHILFSHEMAQANLPLSSHSVTSSLPLKEQVADLEKRIIVNTLKKAKSIRQSAKLLAISHPALINKMKKYKIKNKNMDISVVKIS